jgi:sugar/nucleoside kinase (ribokinase family)
MIGTGGIGSGSFFALSGDHTLRREESRAGRFLQRRDYCKLHIISHYVATLLGDSFETIPIGRVGTDDIGAKLLTEMGATGMDLRYVRSSPNHQTLFSFCLVYPDGSGGNLTTEDSASSYVDPALVYEAEPEFARFPAHAIALAAPEVPLEARNAVLELGTRHGLLRAAAFTSGEMRSALGSGMLGGVDLLGINIDEAAAAAGAPGEGERASAIVEAAVARLRKANAGMIVTVTAGERGSWCWDGSSLGHRPKCSAQVASTAGAGDAHLAGMIVGLAAGLPAGEAHEFAALVAGLSVTSPDTINKGIGRESLRAFAGECGAPLSESVRSLMEG